VNSLALKLAKITSETPDPPQGIIDKNDSHQPSGILRELAMKLVQDVIPPFTEPENRVAIKEALPHLHRLGLTGVHDYRIMAEDVSPVFRAYQQLQEEGDFPIRMWMLLPGERLEDAISLGLRTGFGNDYLRVGHVKYFSDGGQGARTAWMLEQYEDSHTFGMPLSPMNEIADAIQRAHKAGLAVAVHAIGDRANRELISVFENLKTQGMSISPTAPHRIEHVQNIRPEDIIRLAKVGVVASVQPIHVSDDYPMIDKSVGSRARFTYPFRDMLDAGVPMAYGSDCPVANPNPLWGIHTAVTRQMRNSTPAGGWHPSQRISVAEGVRGYTAGAALSRDNYELKAKSKNGRLSSFGWNIYEVDPAEIANVQ
jgi:predicted amidohydrolase YtcJ